MANEYIYIKRKLWYEPNMLISNHYNGKTYYGITASYEDLTKKYDPKNSRWAFDNKKVWIFWLNRPNCPSNECFWSQNNEIKFLEKANYKSLEILYGVKFGKQK